MDNYLTVSKANELILTKSELSFHEEKILAYVISLIDPGQGDFYEQPVTPGTLAEACGIPKAGVYPKVKEIAKQLSQRSLEEQTEDGSWSFIPVMYESRYDSKTKKFYFTLHPRLKTKLLNLRERGFYTRYPLGFIKGFKSK